MDNNGSKAVYVVEAAWNELTRKRLIGLCRILAQKVEEADRQIAMIAYLLRLRRWFGYFFKQTRVIINLPPFYKNDLVRNPALMGFVYGKADLTDYKIKGFWHRGRYYVGPPTKMLRIAIVELLNGLNCRSNYAATMDNKHLDILIATLYRPANPLAFLKILKTGWNGDRRMPLNQVGVDKRARVFKRLDDGLRLAIFLQFTAAAEVFEKQFPYVFKQTDGQSLQNAKVFAQMLFSMSNGIFGTLQQTELVDCWEVFAKLDMDIKANLELKDKTKK